MKRNVTDLKVSASALIHLILENGSLWIRVFRRKKIIHVVDLGNPNKIGFERCRGKGYAVICSGMKVLTFAKGRLWIAEIHVDNSGCVWYHFRPNDSTDDENPKGFRTPHAAFSHAFSLVQGERLDEATDCRLILGVFTPVMQSVIRKHCEEELSANYADKPLCKALDENAKINITNNVFPQQKIAKKQAVSVAKMQRNRKAAQRKPRVKKTLSVGEPKLDSSASADNEAMPPRMDCEADLEFLFQQTYFEELLNEDLGHFFE